MRLHAGAPHGRRRVDALAGRQDGAVLVDRGDRNARPLFDAERRQCLVDDGARLLAHVGADPGLAVGDDHARLPRRAGERGAQFAGHFGRDLDAGQAAADDERRPLPGRSPMPRQRRDMGVEPTAGVVGVDIKPVLFETGDRRAGKPAAEGEDEPVITQWLGVTRQGHPAPRRVDVGYLRLDAGDADRAENVVEKDAGVVELGLVIAHPDRMKRAAVDQGDRDPLRADAELVELARRADRTPQPGKPGAENDDPLHPVWRLREIRHLSRPCFVKRSRPALNDAGA